MPCGHQGSVTEQSDIADRRTLRMVLVGFRFRHTYVHFNGSILDSRARSPFSRDLHRGLPPVELLKVARLPQLLARYDFRQEPRIVELVEKCLHRCDVECIPGKSPQDLIPSAWRAVEL